MRARPSRSRHGGSSRSGGYGGHNELSELRDQWVRTQAQCLAFWRNGLSAASCATSGYACPLTSVYHTLGHFVEARRSPPETCIGTHAVVLQILLSNNGHKSPLGGLADEGNDAHGSIAEAVKSATGSGGGRASAAAAAAGTWALRTCCRARRRSCTRRTCRRTRCRAGSPRSSWLCWRCAAWGQEPAPVGCWSRFGVWGLHAHGAPGAARAAARALRGAAGCAGCARHGARRQYVGVMTMARVCGVHACATPGAARAAAGALRRAAGHAGGAQAWSQETLPVAARACWQAGWQEDQLVILQGAAGASESLIADCSVEGERDVKCACVPLQL